MKIKAEKSIKKARLRAKMLDYMSNPANPDLNRTKLALDVLELKYAERLYDWFSPAEIGAIEFEALNNKRKLYAPKISKVDKGLLKKAHDGDTQAAKLVYQKFEDWSEKSKLEHGFDSQILRALQSILPEHFYNDLIRKLSEMLDTKV